MPKITVFTIGHSNLPVEKLIKLLEIHDIKIIYDVRSVPYSRFPQYNKEKLAQTLQKSGINYIFGGESLGGRINDPACYREKTVPERKVNIAELVDYYELIKRDWFEQGIEQLIDISKRLKTAIMCSEENPVRCHRHLLVARRLVEIGIDVYHIRGDGHLETAMIESGQEVIQQKLF